MELIVQPAEGFKPLVETIARAQKSIDVMIFRFDLKPMEKELVAARDRGVVVRALIAHESSQGDKRLRQLELRMLEKGILVARTGDAFTRYHGKMMIVDREELHVYGFNFTALDLKSRSFGIVTRDRKAVTEAIRVFEADTLRQEYEPQEDGSFVVSPENAREILATFIKRARKQLLIYDPKVADLQMIRLINQRIKAGVDVRIIGKVSKRGANYARAEVARLPAARARDGSRRRHGVCRKPEPARHGTRRPARSRADCEGAENRQASARNVRGRLGKDGPERQGSQRGEEGREGEEGGACCRGGPLISLPTSRRGVAHALDRTPDVQRRVENPSDRNPAAQLVPADRFKPRRRDAAAVGAVRVPAELARRDAPLEIRRKALRRLREDALVR